MVTIYSDLCTEPPPVRPSVRLRSSCTRPSSDSCGTTRSPLYRDWAPEIVAVPGGHVVYWDAYEETAGAIERFLESLPVAS